MNVNQAIKELREFLDIKQELLSKEINVSKGCLSLYENNKRNINNEIFSSICNGLIKLSKSCYSNVLVHELKKLYINDNNYFESFLRELVYAKELTSLINENSIYNRTYNINNFIFYKDCFYVFEISKDDNIIFGEKIELAPTSQGIKLSQVIHMEHFKEELIYDNSCIEDFLELSNNEKLQIFIDYGNRLFENTYERVTKFI